jgi:hypothetical protein
MWTWVFTSAHKIRFNCIHTPYLQLSFPIDIAKKTLIGKLCHFTESLNAFHGHPEFVLHFVKWEEDISRDVRAAPPMSTMWPCKTPVFLTSKISSSLFPKFTHKTETRTAEGAKGRRLLITTHVSPRPIKPSSDPHTAGVRFCCAFCKGLVHKHPPTSAPWRMNGSK